MTKDELRAKIDNLQKRAWDVWTSAHAIPRDLGTDDKCFFDSGGVKHLVCDLVDNLAKVGKYLEPFCDDDELQSELDAEA